MAFQGETQGQIQDFLKILRKRIPQVLLITAFIATLGVSFAVLVPKKYLKEQRVELMATRVQADPVLRNPNQAAVNQEATNARYHLENTSRVRQVLDELAWPDYAAVTTNTERADYVAMVIRNIDVRLLEKGRNEGSTFVDVSYKDVHPRRTVTLLRRLIDVWITDVVDRDRLLLQEELKQALDDREALMKVHEEKAERRKNLQRELQIPSVAPGTQLPVQDPVYEELTRISALQETHREQLAADEAELEALRAGLDDTPSTIAVSKAPQTTGASAALSALQAEIAQKQLVLQKFKPAHSMYKRTLTEIESLEQQLEAATAVVPSAQPTTTYEINPARAKLSEAIAELEAGVQRNRALLKELDRKEIEYRQRYEERLEHFKDLEILNLELESLKAQRIAADAEYNRKNSAYAALRRSSGVPFKIVGDWIEPEEPSTPNPYLIVAFSVVAGLALGLVLAFLGEFSKNCYRSVNDVTRVMSAPVLGIINTITTRREARRTRVRALVVTVSTLLIMAGIGWLTWAYVRAPDLLGTELVQRIDDVRMMFR